MQKHAYMVLVVYEGAPSITPFESLAEAEQFFERASAQWSEAYILGVICGPRDASTPAEQMFGRQFTRFEIDLPALMREHQNEWVVYLDGARHYAETESDAIRWAFKNLPADAGFVVAQVRQQVPVLMTAAIAFGGVVESADPRDDEINRLRHAISLIQTVRCGVNIKSETGWNPCRRTAMKVDECGIPHCDECAREGEFRDLDYAMLQHCAWLVEVPNDDELCRQLHERSSSSVSDRVLLGTRWNVGSDGSPRRPTRNHRRGERGATVYQPNHRASKRTDLAASGKQDRIRWSREDAAHVGARCVRRRDHPRMLTSGHPRLRRTDVPPCDHHRADGGAATHRGSEMSTSEKGDQDTAADRLRDFATHARLAVGMARVDNPTARGMAGIGWKLR